MRYYYKDINGNLYCLKEPQQFYTEQMQLVEIPQEDGTTITENQLVKVSYNAEITEEEYNALQPKIEIDEEKVAKRNLIAEKKRLLEKYKEDVEQVELFGMERDDYEEKKQLCATIICELRELERE